MTACVLRHDGGLDLAQLDHEAVQVLLRLGEFDGQEDGSAEERELEGRDVL